MILITGGIAQGKSSFAASFGLPVIDDLEQRIQAWLAQGFDVDGALAKHFAAIELQAATTTQCLAPTNCVIVCAEIGCGIVPLAKEERIWREVVGRTACRLAAEADAVYQMTAGIAVQLK